MCIHQTATAKDHNWTLTGDKFDDCRCKVDNMQLSTLHAAFVELHEASTGLNPDKPGTLANSDWRRLGCTWYRGNRKGPERRR